MLNAQIEILDASDINKVIDASDGTTEKATLNGDIGTADCITKLVITDGVNTIEINPAEVTIKADGTFTLDNIDVSSLNDGTLSVNLEVADANGNKATCTDTIIKDTLAEVHIDITDSRIEGTTAILTGTVVGVEEGKQITVNFIDGSGTAVRGTGLVKADGTWEVQTDVNVLTHGDIQAGVYTNDNAGNQSTDCTKNIGQIISTLKAEIQILDEDDANTVIDASSGTTEKAILTGDIGIGNEIAKLVVTDGVNTIEINPADVTINADGTFTVDNVDVSSLNDGILSVNLEAKDANGNKASDSDTIKKDTLAEVHIDITDSRIEGTTAILTGTVVGVEEGKQVTVNFIDGSGTTVRGTGLVKADGTWEVQTDVSILTHGDIKAGVYTNDNAGNQSTDCTKNIGQLEVAPEALNDNYTLDEDTSAVLNILNNDKDADGTIDPSTVVITKQPEHGTLTVNPDGTVKYTPDANYNGSDEFTYTVKDNDGLESNPAVVKLTVNDTNEAPVAIDDINTDKSGTVLVHEDFENGAQGWSNNTVHNGGSEATKFLGRFGKGTICADGSEQVSKTFNFGSENAGKKVVIEFDMYEIDSWDANRYWGDRGITEAFTVYTNGSKVVDDTMAVDQAYGNLDEHAGEKMTQNIAGTSGWEDEKHHYKLEATIDANGQVKLGFGARLGEHFTNESFGIDNVKITAGENFVEGNVTKEDTAITLDILDNDYDVDGTIDPTTVVITKQPANGTLTVNPDGTVKYTPNKDYNGDDEFTYTVKDNDGLVSNEAVVKITVTPENDVVIINNATAIVSEEGLANGIKDSNGNQDTTNKAQITGKMNISDVDGDNIDVTLTAPSETLKSNGQIIKWYGNDTAELIGKVGNKEVIRVNIDDNGDYKVKLSAPVDHANKTIEDNLSLNIGVKASDGTAVSKASLTVKIEDDMPTSCDITKEIDVEATANTFVVKNLDAGFKNSVYLNGKYYVRESNTDSHDNLKDKLEWGKKYYSNHGQSGYNLVDNSVFTNSKGSEVESNEVFKLADFTHKNWAIYSNSSNLDKTTLTMSMDIEINGKTTPINFNVLVDHTETRNTNNAMESRDIIVLQDKEISVTVDGQDYVFKLEGFKDANGNFVDKIYTNEAANNTFGIYGSVSSTGSDMATISGDVCYEAGADGLDSIKWGNLDSQYGTMNVDANGKYTFTVNEKTANTLQVGQSVTQSFTYTIIDNDGDKSTSTVNIKINGSAPVNDAPDAKNDYMTTNEDCGVVIGVLNNDSDTNGDTLNIESITQPAHGKVTVNNNGSVTYIPDANYNGNDSFTYTISDGKGGFDTATVTVKVNPSNDKPVAVDDIKVLNEDQAVNINVLANDRDVETATKDLRITSISQPSHGFVVINNDGTVKYTPAKDYNGKDSFSYTIVDEHGKTDTATVNLTVKPTNDNPVAVNDIKTLNEDQSIKINVLGNDRDPDGDSLSVSGIASQPEHGSVCINRDGTITYTPDHNYSGKDKFTYQITDGKGGFDTATVDLVVKEDNPINAQLCGTSDMAEGNNGWYNVRLDKAVSEDTWVNVQVSNGSACRVDANGWQQANQDIMWGGKYSVGYSSSHILYYVYDRVPNGTYLSSGSRPQVGPDYATWDYTVEKNGQVQKGGVVSVLIKAGHTQSEYFEVQSWKEKITTDNFIHSQNAGKEYVENFKMRITGVNGNDSDDIDYTSNYKNVNIHDRSYINKVSPITLDLSGDGEIGVTGETSSIDKDMDAQIGTTVEFDIDADGTKDTIEWIDGSGDGLLVDNRDGNAANDMDGSRLFGDEGGKYENGYEKLAQFDTNNDGQISGEELNGLNVWVDDGDAKVEDGELKSLADFDITSISTQMTATTGADGKMHMQSVATKEDGSQIMTEDVWFGAETVDIEAVIQNDNGSNVADFSNGKADNIKIDMNDILDSFDINSELYITGDNEDKVDLDVDQWQSNGKVEIENTQYNSYSSNGKSLLIDEDIEVNPDL